MFESKSTLCADSTKFESLVSYAAGSLQGLDDAFAIFFLSYFAVTYLMYVSLVH